MASFSNIGRTGIHQDLLLKVTPPRLPRDLVTRTRLIATADALRGFSAFVVTAPPGFGKTYLLTQWRKEIQSTGVPVAWVSSQTRDNPHRLVRSIALALRVVSGQSSFGHAAFEYDGDDPLEHATVLLSELAQAAMDLALIIDEADRLPQASRDTLVYLLCEAPPNLRTVIATRPDWQPEIDDLVAYGQCMLIGPTLLRFDLEETLQLVQSRIGVRIDRTLAARLHVLTEGWPLGLQLALTIVARSVDASAGITDMAMLGGELQAQLVTRLLANLAVPDHDFLVRIAVLNHLHPDLCRTVTGDPDAASRLLRLSLDTPVFTNAESSPWLRMHALVRDALRQRFDTLDAEQHVETHARAARWLAEEGFLDDAARHAMSAGQHQTAYNLAERSLYEAMMHGGHQATVLDWLGQVPTEELDRRPRLLLVMAWTLASSERHAEAERVVNRILALPAVSDAMRCECALLLSGAAVFADDPDRFVALHAPWTQSSVLTDPLLLQVHANRMAYRALLDGQPAQARLLLQQTPGSERQQDNGYTQRWGDLIIGLSYIREGQMQQADRVLRPALRSAEMALGRRNRFSCMLAALLAVATWENDHPADAAALLADRLDILEHSGLPDALLLAYQISARVALTEGSEHLALDLLGGLDAIGTARGLLRLRLASLLEQVRLHARSYRAQTCSELLTQMNTLLKPALADDRQPSRGPIWRRDIEALHDLTQVYVAIAAKDWNDALAPLSRVDEYARRMGMSRLHIELLGLRALALARCGQDAHRLMREAIDLAQAFGLQRVFADAHPELVAWTATLEKDGALPDPNTPTLATPKANPPTPSAIQGGVLTPKEQEVLSLLARNMSNKEIGRAMDVGETTIKWHVKNLFDKLDAGSRKQVVQRARILGLIEL
jgi:LuxR family transcriptional regulator, maltose regulon positive regulatory protein